MSTVTCPDCDEKLTLKPGRTSAKCPACGGSVKADGPAARSGRRSDDDDDDRREKAEKKKPKRKYREEWDDEDDGDDDRRKPPPKPKGSLGWLWILLGVVALFLATCGGLGYWLFSTARKARDDFAQRVEQDQQRMHMQPGNPQGRAKPPAQPNAAVYPKKKPFDTDPQLVAKPSPVYLDDLDPFDVRQGDWPVGRHGALGFDDRWVCVNGTYYDHGIGLIPPNNGAARMSFATGGQARRLKGQVALNDYWHDGDAWNEVTFAVYKDGKEVWRSQPMKKKKMPQAFDVDVTGARVVMIEANAPASAHDAHCVWLDPVLVK